MDKDLIAVGIACAGIARAKQSLIAYALGSCIAICLRDRERQIAGMAHILLPDSAQAVRGENPYKFADTGLEALIMEMERYGARSGRLEAKIAGGAEMFGTLYAKTGGIGEKNSAAALAALAARSIPVLAKDIGENYGRTLVYSARSGLLTVRAARRGERTI